MGWKNIKEHFGIRHIVHVTEEGICIGSPYIHDLIVIGTNGHIIKGRPDTLDADLQRYQRAFADDPEAVRRLIEALDTFSYSVSVYTYDGGEIIEKFCDEPGWPNVTHDGAIMYENTYSTDRNQVALWAKRNAALGAEWTRKAIAERESELADMRAKLAGHEADAAALAAAYPDVRDPSQAPVTGA